MFCRFCGQAIPGDSCYCPNCGRAQNAEAAMPSSNPLFSNSKAGQSPSMAGLFESDGPSSDLEAAPIEANRVQNCPVIAQSSIPAEPSDAHAAVQDAVPWAAAGPISHVPSPPVNSHSAPPRRSRRTSVLLVCLILTLAFGIFGIAGAVRSLQEDAERSRERQIEAGPSGEVMAPAVFSPLSSNEIARLSVSVLTLYIYDEAGELLQTGSGFVAFDDQTLVTNYHVIEHGYSVEAVSESNDSYSILGARYYDRGADIAILQFAARSGLPVLELADSQNVQIGDTVYAIGSPLELKNTVSNGIVSAIRDVGSYYDIQTTAPISAGSSGGVLLNEYGQVIGITYATYNAGQNLNLAIPSEEFMDLKLPQEAASFADIAARYRPVVSSH